jgi:hypothetical protein
VYINKVTKILIVTYVNDFLVILKAGLALKDFKKEILSLFNIVPIGPIYYFLGVKIVKDKEKKTISLY